MVQAISYPIKKMTYEPHENPMGLEGFEFIEYCSPRPEELITHMRNFGFTQTYKHKDFNIQLFQQNEINFFLNFAPNTHAAQFAKLHGPSASAMGFRVKDAKFAYERAVELGAEPLNLDEYSLGLDLPAIYGIGGSLIYFVDDTNREKYMQHFQALHDTQPDLSGNNLQYIDHLTHNVCQGNMDPWADFYMNLFNFKQIRFFDIEGQKTGLISRAMASPCDKIKIPLNESKDAKSQIEEFIKEFNGEGIQHIALATPQIFDTVEQLRDQNINFLYTPDTYYDQINDRVPGHEESVERMKADKILIDGNPETGEGILLQIFTENLLGPVFFEIIQRKENEGFGEGNFQALFEAIELDQMQRGTL